MSFRSPLLLTLLVSVAPAFAADLPLHASPLEPPAAIEASPGNALQMPPPRSLPLVQVVKQTYTWDELPISYRVFQAGPLRVRLPWEVFDAWSLKHEAGTGDIHGSAPGFADTRLRLMLLPGGGPLGKLADARWQAYLAGLAPDAAAKPPTLFANDDTEDNPQMLTLLGGRSRFASVESTVARGEKRRSLHAAVALPEGVVLFVLEGPPAAVERAQSAFASLLTALDVVP